MVYGFSTYFIFPIFTGFIKFMFDDPTVFKYCFDILDGKFSLFHSFESMVAENGSSMVKDMTDKSDCLIVRKHRVPFVCGIPSPFTHVIILGYY